MSAVALKLKAADRFAGPTSACLCGMTTGYAVADTGDADIVRAKQSVKDGDGTILQSRGVGVWQGSDWQEIDRGTGVSRRPLSRADKRPSQQICYSFGVSLWCIT